MDWQQFLPSIVTTGVAFISGIGLAISKGFAKAVEDIWTDYWSNKKNTRLRKREIVNQLLFDIPRGKSQQFKTTRDSRSWEHTIAQIAIYDKKMSKRVAQYLYLWRRYILSQQEFDRLGEIILMGPGDDTTTKGPEYLEELLSQLYSEYDEIIDLLNSWSK